MRANATTYEGTERLRGEERGARSSWSDFLRAATDAGAPKYVRVDLLPVKPELATANASLLRKLESAYGQPTHRTDLDIWFWYVDLSEVDYACGILRAPKSVPKSRLGGLALAVTIRHDFSLLDPDTGQPLDPQGSDGYGTFCADEKRLLYLGQCQGNLCLSATAQSYLWLSFPFTVKDQGFLKVLSAVREGTDLRLSKGKWRSWTLAKNGCTYAKRVIKGSL